MTDKATDPAAGGAVTTPDPAAPTVEPSPEPTQTTQPPAEAKPDPQKPPGEPEAAKEGEDEKKKNRVPYDERIRQLTSRQRLAERERDRALARAHQAEAELAELRKKNVADLSYDQRERLNLDEALAERDLRQARLEARDRLSEFEQTREEARIARNQSFIEKLQEAEARMPGLYQSFARIPLTEPLAEFIGESELGVEIAHFLTKPENAKVLDELNELTFSDPRQRIYPRGEDLARANRIMARIEGRLEKAPPIRKATTAPAPGTTLNGATPSAGPKTYAEMTDAEAAAYERKRRKEAAAR